MRNRDELAENGSRVRVQHLTLIPINLIALFDFDERDIFRPIGKNG
jgi:hypothetical protein